MKVGFEVHRERGHPCNRWARWLTLLFLTLALVTFGGISGSPGGNGVVAQAADDKDTTSAFADAASELSNQLSDSKKTYAGDLWSYIGPKTSFLGKATQHSFSTTYNNLDAGSDKKATNKAMNSAGNFGYMMTQTGLDHSDTAGFGMINFVNGLGRGVIGIIAMLGFIFTAGVIWMFNILLTMLNWIDFWSWLGDTTNAPAAMRPLAQVIQGTFKIGQQIGLVGMCITLGLSLVLAIMGIRSTGGDGMRQTRTGSGFMGVLQGFITKAFIIFGLPMILIWSSSVTISITKGLFQNLNSSSLATYAIYSNLVDAKGWIEGSRLAIPKGVTIPDSHSASDVPVISKQQVILINAEGAGRATAQEVLSSSNHDPDHSTQLTYNSNTPALESAPMSMLQDWFSSATYKASDWASFTQSHYNGKISELKKDLVGKGKTNLVTDGTLTTNSKNFTTSATQSTGNSTQSKARIEPGTPGGLSTMGMYNYLSSVFTSSNFVWSDITGFSNMSTSPQHYSIGLVGRGAVAMGNGLMLITLTLVGGLFAFACGWITLKGMLQSLPGMWIGLTGAVGGSVRSGIRLVINFLDFVVSCIGGGVFYLFGAEFLEAIAQAPDSFFGLGAKGIDPDSKLALLVPSSLSSGAHGVTMAAANGFLYGALTTLSAIFIWAICIFLMRNITPVLKLMRALYGNLEKALREATLGVERGGDTPGTGGPPPAFGGLAGAAGAPGNDGKGNDGKSGFGMMESGNKTPGASSPDDKKSSGHSSGTNGISGKGSGRRSVNATEQDDPSSLHGTGSGSGGAASGTAADAARESRIGSPLALMGLPSPEEANQGAGEAENAESNMSDSAQTGAGEAINNAQNLAGDNLAENAGNVAHEESPIDASTTDASDQSAQNRNMEDLLQQENNKTGDQVENADNGQMTQQDLSDNSTNQQSDMTALNDQDGQSLAQPMDSEMNAGQGSDATNQTVNDQDTTVGGNQNSNMSQELQKGTGQAVAAKAGIAAANKAAAIATTGGNTTLNQNNGGQVAKSFNQAAAPGRTGVGATRQTPSTHGLTDHGSSPASANFNAINHGGQTIASSMANNSATINPTMTGQMASGNFNSPAQAHSALSSARANMQQTQRTLSQTAKGSAGYARAVSDNNQATAQYRQTQQQVVSYQSKQPVAASLMNYQSGATPRMTQGAAFSQFHSLSNAYNQFTVARQSGDPAKIEQAGQALASARHSMNAAGFSNEYVATPQGAARGMEAVKAGMTFTKDVRH